MAIRVDFYEDASSIWAVAKEFLRSSPVLHNLILTLIDGRLTHPEPGRYWVAFRAGQVAGLVFQSPLMHPALLVPMSPDVIEGLVDAIADQGVALPGINGEAATAANFAGRWAERCKSAAFPTQELRLYELAMLNPMPSVTGKLRRAGEADRDLAIAWLRAFDAEIHEPGSDYERRVTDWIGSGQFWLWQDDEPVSMVVCRKPCQDVVRVSGVYTPAPNRERGYAGACVAEISKQQTEAGYRCVLYTDLGNPTSNSVYRKIGYRAIAEFLHYRFDR